MCGRYYIDDEAAREIVKLVNQIDENSRIRVGDIHPTDPAPVIHAFKDRLEMSQMVWGFPNFTGKGVIFNGRSESAFNKPMFRDSVQNRRCVIPAAKFYEWDKSKNKITFFRSHNQLLFLAGFYHSYNKQNQFVILTTQANNSVADVHPRMPLILEREEMESWMFNKDSVKQILHKEPLLLERQSEYEQQRLKFH